MLLAKFILGSLILLSFAVLMVLAMRDLGRSTLDEASRLRRGKFSVQFYRRVVLLGIATIASFVGAIVFQREFRELLLILLIVTMMGILTLLPLLTFLVLFTKMGDGFWRLISRKPARQHFRFGMKSLLFSMATVGVCCGIIRLLVPQPNPWNYWMAWLILSIPLSMGLVFVRIALEGWLERKYRLSQLAKRDANASFENLEMDLQIHADEEREKWSLRHADDRHQDYGGLRKSTNVKNDPFGRL